MHSLRSAFMTFQRRISKNETLETLESNFALLKLGEEIYNIKWKIILSNSLQF